MLSELDEKNTELLAKKKHWILDVDGCIYPRDLYESGYYQKLSRNMKRAFKKAAFNWTSSKGAIAIALRTVADKPSLAGTIGIGLFNSFRKSIKNNSQNKDKKFKVVTNLYEGFLPFVKAVRNRFPKEFSGIVNSFYGNDYAMLKKDFNLVSALRTAKENGIDVNFYTNSPVGSDDKGFFHSGRVLQSKGFSDDEVAFYNQKSYGMFHSIENGVMGKPTRKDMKNFFEFANIKNPEDAVMFDDNVANLKTAALFGVTPVWTWTSDEEPSRKELVEALEIGAIIVRHTGAALLQLANKATANKLKP